MRLVLAKALISTGSFRSLWDFQTAAPWPPFFTLRSANSGDLQFRIDFRNGMRLNSPFFSNARINSRKIGTGP